MQRQLSGVGTESRLSGQHSCTAADSEFCLLANYRPQMSLSSADQVLLLGSKNTTGITHMNGSEEAGRTPKSGYLVANKQNGQKARECYEYFDVSRLDALIVLHSCHAKNTSNNHGHLLLAYVLCMMHISLSQSFSRKQ